LSDTLVLSPFENFGTTQQVYDAETKVLSFGIRDAVTTIPAEYRIASIVVHGQDGIRQTMWDWGHVLMDNGGKPTGVWKSDLSLSYLGYGPCKTAY